MARRYGKHGQKWSLQIDYSIILELSNTYPIKFICDTLGIKRDGFYKWIKRNISFAKSSQEALRSYRMVLFKEYHEKYKTHGYRWLNAKIKLDIKDFKCSNNTAHKICNFLGIISKSKHEKQEYSDFITCLHTDGGSVYKSKTYNLKLDLNGFIHSMSAPGTPTENGAMEAINGWTKEELIRDYMLLKGENINEALENYMYYFNYERPAAALNYLTPIQYKEKYFITNKLMLQPQLCIQRLD